MDREKKEKGHVGPTSKKKTNKQKDGNQNETDAEEFEPK